ncbi:DUF2059 domain-containing protein [Qipengyuania sp. XHP0211]|uniref:DUF2059 domain-containing protein n=1 Tax=Qipengyuania sp. XHP0211 TaxID=3038079 RepID=UPI00241E513A|nr:DUF2059 domain-containing protein [Qipengyuania sp. XHP0211]MDG5752159.1 DUF2059 domain-containing protein [Qipengyuania sp. XHP0211]
MRNVLKTASFSLALAMTTPAWAQDEVEATTEIPAGDSMAEIAQMMGAIFQTEPLTAEQEERLPQAEALVGTMMPEGFYGTMMSEMMDKMMRPMMSMFTQPKFVLAGRLEIDQERLDALDEEQRAELAGLLDPGYAERADAIINVMTDKMGGAFSVMEKPMREGLSKAYAVRFDENQLADIAAFFATPTGEIYAREQMALFADPQVMQSSMQALPAMMGSFGDMETAMAEAMATLPAERSYADLTEAERARMAELLGVDAAALEDVVKPPKPMEKETISSGL